MPSAPAPCVCSSLPLSLCVGISFCPTSQDTLEVCCVAWQHWDGLRGEAGVGGLDSLGIEVPVAIDGLLVGILLMEGWDTAITSLARGKPNLLGSASGLAEVVATPGLPCRQLGSSCGCPGTSWGDWCRGWLWSTASCLAACLHMVR